MNRQHFLLQSSQNPLSRRRFCLLPRPNCLLPLGVLITLSIFSQNASAQMYVIGSSGQFGTIDPLTGTINVIGTTTTDVGPTIFSGLAWTPNNSRFYSVRGDTGADNGLYRINPTNASTTYLRDIGTSLVTIASRTDGVLFGFSSDFTSNTSTLWRINPVTESVATQVGLAGALGPANLGALTFDSSGNLYMINDTTGQLFTVNTTTGATTPVGAGTGTDSVYGMTGDGNGNYYGFSATGRSIYTINLTAGGATLVPPTYSFGPTNPLDVIFGATAVIPEPATGCLMLLGSVGIVARRKKQGK
jgi:streptogramin lyase